jgi:hypothetical protein
MAKSMNAKQKEVLARKLGYEGPMNSFEAFVKSDPGMERKYNAVIERYMARGGMVKKYAVGGAVTGGQLDFRQMDITQYPLTAAQRTQVNSALRSLPKLEADVIERSKPGYSGLLTKDTAIKNLRDAENVIASNLKASEDTLNRVMSEYLLNAGRILTGQEQLNVPKNLASYTVNGTARAYGKSPEAVYNELTENLNSVFAAYNAKVPELLKDKQYITDSFTKINEAAKRQGQPEIVFAETFIRSTDNAVSVVTPKENLIQDYVNKVEKGEVLQEAGVVRDGAGKIVLGRDTRMGKQLPVAATPDPKYTQPIVDSLIMEKSISAPKYAEKYRPETLAMLEMAQGKRKADLSYDLDGDGKVTQQDFDYYTNAQDSNNDGRITLEEALAYAREEVKKIQAAQQPQQPAPSMPTATTTPTIPATGGSTAGTATPTPTTPTVPGATPVDMGTAGTIGGTTPTTATPLPGTTGIGTSPSLTQSTVAPTTPVGTGTPTPSQPVPAGTPTTPITEASPVTGTVTTPTAPGVGSVTSPITTPVSPAPTTPTAPTTPPVESITAPAADFTPPDRTDLPEKAPGVATVPQIDTAIIQPTLQQQVSTPTAPTAAVTAIPQMATGTAQVADVIPRTAATVGTTFATPGVAGALSGVQAEQGTVSQQAQVQAATMEPTSTAVGDLQAAQGVAGTVQGAPTRTLQEGELVSGPAVDQAKIEATLQANEAAQGVVTEDMTVQGQLARLTADFEASNPPAWAAGSLRAANAILAQRGLGASSLAGQAVIQAALEAALPIAAADAQTYREMGIQNLSNKQQMAVLTAQQRAAFLGQEFDQAFQTRAINAATISQIANVNFNAQQQIALENARLAETVNLANLSNRQALVMAEAAQIANLETANLNNRQQANVLNAQAFLQMDMTNLNNRQQTAIFKAQSMVQSILSDAAADNASKQFNASSINQVNQFYDGLSTQIKQFNATQTNAMNQFNVGQLNSIAQFNASMQNQRDQFNAEFRKVIDQSNAEWRRNIALQNTAAVNRSNEFNATAALGVTTIEYNNLWQDYRDKLEYAWKTAENAMDRENELARQVLAKQAQIEAAKMQVEAEKMKALGQLGATVLDKTGALKAAGEFLFGSDATSDGKGGAAGATKGVITGGLEALKQKIFGSNTGYTAVTKKDDPNQYWTDGKTMLTLKPNGDFYVGTDLLGNYSGDTSGKTEFGGFDYSYGGNFTGNTPGLSLDDFLNSSTQDWSNYNYSGVSE